MGKLVKFEPRERPALAAGKTCGHAQILLFTGVRYERSAPCPPGDLRDPSRPKRRRG